MLVASVLGSLHKGSQLATQKLRLPLKSLVSRSGYAVCSSERRAIFRLVRGLAKERFDFRTPTQ
jgi:hypothetical protein